MAQSFVSSVTPAVQTTGDWVEVLKQQQLAPTVDAAAVVVLTSTNAGQIYTSQGNDVYFTKGDASVATGDAQGSGVLLLLKNNSGTMTLKDLMAAIFGDRFSKSAPLISLLDTTVQGKTDSRSSFIQGTPVTSVFDSAQQPDPSDPENKNKTITVYHVDPARTIHAGALTNAVWCIVTENQYEQTTCLSYTIGGTPATTKPDGTSNNDAVTLDDIRAWALNWVNTYLGIPSASIKTVDFSLPNLPPVTVTLSNTSLFKVGYTAGTRPHQQTKLSLSVPIFSFALHLDIADDDYELLLVPSTTGTSIKDMITGTFSTQDNLALDVLPDGQDSNFFTSLFDHVDLWYVRITKTTSLQWGIALISVWKPNSNTQAVFSMSYDSQTATFLGRLMFAADLPTAAELRLPTWDPRISLPTSLDSLGTSLDLWDLLNLTGTDQPPLPHRITSAKVSFARDTATSGASLFSISADLDGGAVPTSATGGAPPGFKWLTAGLELIVRSPSKTSQQAKTYSMNFYSTMTLVGSANISPATFAVGIHGDTLSGASNWILRASAQNLSIGLLESFFTDEVSTGAMAVMNNITLQSLDVLYMYQGNKGASFILTGVLLLGLLELDLSYQYVSTVVPTTTDAAAPETATSLYLVENPTSTKLPKDTKNQYTTVKSDTQSMFVAKLGITSPNSTVADIAESIVPGAGAKLPTWVGGIAVNPVTKDGTAPPAVELEFKSSKTSDATSSLLSVWVSIAGFNLTFIQYHSTDKVTGGTKRVLRIGVDQIPMMQDIPLIGKLPQPFDHLDYLWVEDTTANPLGITRNELDTIAGLYPDDIPAFQYKDDKSSPAATDVLLAMGHHFVVVVKGKVVLDHVFQTSAAETQPETQPETDAKSPDSSSKDPAAKDEKQRVVKPGPEGKPTKGNTVATVGPLSVTALTLQYKNGSLFVTIDATLNLGPLTFSVIGFVIELKLNSVKLDHLANIVTDKLIDVTLHGLEVGVEKGPLTLEGVFIHEDTPEAETYSGGIAVGLKAWQILAIGQYRIQKPTTTTPNGFRSVFVYGKLDGPLVELEVATISGVRLGFGYNYGIRMPQVQDLYDFPFIADHPTQGSGNDPMKVLDAMVNTAPYYVYPKEGSVWFCAGMTIKAVEVVTITAVLMVDIDTGKSDPNSKGVIMALLGDGVFQMEPEAPPDFTLFYIELVISVELNFVDGYIAANAVLAPASHVYVPQARLSGGASFYTWFGNNSHAGEWVGTVGGFPRGYDIPSYYPNPDRVALSFIIGDMIHVVGQAYLAITPKCAMAGGMLHLSLSVGPVSAYLDLTFDAFINFKPFHFKVGISLAIGIECDIDILFIHIHISISLGADLTVWGPNEFGGHAHVNFWFFGFDVDFGSDENPGVTNPLSLPAFWQMVLTSGPGSSPPTNDTIAKADGGGTELTQHKYSVEDGLMAVSTPAADKDNFPSTGATTTWQVKAGSLKIRVDTVFALSGAHFVQPDPNDSSKQVSTNIIQIPGTSDQTVPAVHAFPMHNAEGNPISSTMEISIFNIDDVKNPVLKGGFKGELVFKAVPTAVWNSWDVAHDPLHTQNPASLHDTTNATKNLVMGIRILPPDPVLCKSLIVDFDATAAMRETFSGDTHGSFHLPSTTAQNTLFSGAYFQPSVADLTGDPTNDDKVIPEQIKRWQDFGTLWQEPDPARPGSAATTTTTTGWKNALVTAERKEMLTAIANLLEWDIPPPQLRPSSNAAPATTAAAPTSSSSATAAVVPVVPYWQLSEAQPVALINDVDTYYPTLPFVLAASA